MNPELKLAIIDWWERVLEWCKALFRRTPIQRPLLKEGINYTFTEIMLDEWVNAVKVLDGPFKDVIYYYGHVKLIPNDDGSNRLAYQYTIWDPAGREKNQLVGSPEFMNLIGDILVSIIADENGQGEYATPRSHDTEESDLQ